jgi:nucleotide-binding universal stress UspA family protein
MQKVLIPLDYDSDSNKIAKIGYELAQKIGATTILLHVLNDQANFTNMQYDPMMGMSSFDYTVFADVMDTESYKSAGNAYLKHVKEDLADDNIQLLVKIGDSTEEILSTANEIGADLIVMGTHSKKWLEKMLVGSTAENVLQKTKIPLMLIPTKKEEKD